MECENCCEDYNENEYVPLNLECGHTYCKQCVIKLLQ